MSVLKCKMCGGDLEVAEDINIVGCEYCGTKQTVPNADNEKKVNLFNRANRLRMASEFDKAAGIYENIIAEFPEEAEAYWGFCLCNYGIEYVDDPATAKKIPTCHRASFESLQKDENYELALEYADVVAQKVYRDEAREIDRIMSEILAVSKNEKPYDVFICYKETDEKGERTVDSVLAYDIYEALTAKGLNVFFARVTLEDKLGRQYEPYIFAALNSAKVMLSIGTKYEYFHAVWVKNEWSRFLKLMAKDKSKVLIPCFKDIDAYDMPDEFKGLQAQDLGKLGAVQDIVRGVEKLIGKSEPSQTVEKVVANQGGGPNVEALLKRGFLALEDSDFNGAKVHFDKVLDMNAECAEAYLGFAMAEIGVSTELELVYSGKINNKKYIRAKQYADEAMLDRLKTLEKTAEEEHIRRKKEAEEERIRLEKEAEEERIREEKEAEEEKKRLKKFRRDINSTKNMIAASSCTVGLNSDGTVIAVGDNEYGQCNVSQWENVAAVSTGDCHTLGLKKDGSVVATGKNHVGQCNVSGWNNIVSIAANYTNTIGLKDDGTVVAVGDNRFGELDISEWKNIVDIAAGSGHTVGLRCDGTVVATKYTGEYYDGQCDVSDWKNIVAIDAGYFFTAGLKSDGTVVVAGKTTSDEGSINVGRWNNIVAIAAGCFHLVGLKSDGSVVAEGVNRFGQCNTSEWNNIVAIAAGFYLTIGLKEDGTVVAIGKNTDGQCDISRWKLFDDFGNLEVERKIKLEGRKHIIEGKKRIEEQKVAYRQQGLCQHCGGTFKGLFTKKCSNCGKAKDY
ncbi:MAG: TIR domain-containing protein [Clostridia bacterium]|nr:TIR domain-containing protein [Clostridia bacterium]